MKLKFGVVAGCLALASLSGCKSTEQKMADSALLSNCNLVTFTNYEDMESAHPNKIPNLSTEYTYWKGSSLLPFGSRDAAIEEATINVCKNGGKFALVNRDKETTYSAQERLVGGVYHEYFLMPYDYIEVNEVNLISQLDAWALTNNSKFGEAHRKRLFALAKENTQFTSVTPIIEKYIKNAKDFSKSSYTTPLGNSIRYKKYEELYDNLVEVYVAHNVEKAPLKLENWVKYHPVPVVKYMSYKYLIKLDEMPVVESLLAVESNKNLKKEVGKLLI
ncbi:hypothetical protein ABMY47_03445 [Pseudoalteromonas sp. BZP1]|uniref:hypothetical protein n=1 Tax=unclassified Pseudoalteromonas TaxID=194690 RepID=UPI00259A3EE9|nr:hypothetical protein [uncultured Pseudoalteromonas sp.]|tara:strand:+ start:630 stop:1457 length:828 start_codon:yes stop_codon:yes gene_type:complete